LKDRIIPLSQHAIAKKENFVSFPLAVRILRMVAALVLKYHPVIVRFYRIKLLIILLFI